MAVSILDAILSTPDNNTNQMVPSAGTDRYWVIACNREGAVSGNATITVDGTVPTVFDLICWNGSAASGEVSIYGCKDADIGSGISTSNGSLETIATSSNDCRVYNMVFQGVDQTTPYTNIEDDGWSIFDDASGQNLLFTLDETVDAMGIAIGGTSANPTTWILDNGYTHEASSPYTGDINWETIITSKTISSESLGQLTTFDNGSSGVRLGLAAIMLLPAGGGGTNTDILIPTGPLR